LLELKSEKEAELIINSVVKACTTDINALTKSAYDFIMLASGFIAHYNREGFIQHYETPEELKHAILNFRMWNQWDNFRKGETDYEYYMQKKDIYNKICNRII